jgi:4-diphosphocytidyl-2-C-methyl-D-erythritol kinase
MNELTESAPAKLSLGLDVRASVDQSKHPVEALFCSLDLADELSLTWTKGEPQLNIITAEGIAPLDITPQQNLVWQAYQVFCESYEQDFESIYGNPDITLLKRIPSQAGLGGGSSDAAAMLRMLCKLIRIPLDDPELFQIARVIGSDVPYCLRGGCASYGGYNDCFKEAFAVPHLDLVLAKPQQGVPTVEAYRAFDRLQSAPVSLEPLYGVLREPASRDTATRLAHCLRNNLLEAAETVCPALGPLERMMSHCPQSLGVGLAGSGSTLFAVCASRKDAVQMAATLKELGQEALVALTI